MLNDAERRVLRDIEVEMSLGDPKLAAALASHGTERARNWTRFGHDLVMVVAALLAVICMALSGSGGAPGGFAAMGFAVLVGALRLRRFPRGRRDSA